MATFKVTFPPLSSPAQLQRSFGPMVALVDKVLAETRIVLKAVTQ
jgi:hypothetical protein